ncbi:hypothetical protein [Treponema sp.]|uniref:hypothetical protein n=1 Tax=Treponema sp. TaxID=166 RepID=UPI003FA2A2A3
MKSTKLKIGFLLAVLTAVILAGCKPITKSDLQKEFGLPDREQRKASLVESMKRDAWNNFYNKETYDSSVSSYPQPKIGINYEDLMDKDVTADTIKTQVKKWNEDNEKKNATPQDKFNKNIRLYAQLTYKGSGEKKSNYAGKKLDEVKNAFSQQFDIAIVGDIEAYLNKYGQHGIR